MRIGGEAAESTAAATREHCSCILSEDAPVRPLHGSQPRPTGLNRAPSTILAESLTSMWRATHRSSQPAFR